MIFSILAAAGKAVVGAVAANPMAAASLASGALGAYGSVQQGKAEAEALEEQARQEKVQAEAAELLRREELNRQLAAQTAALAASGVTAEGTPASISLEQARTIGKSERSIGLKSRLSMADKQRKARAARSAGKTGAITGLLQQSTSLIGAGKTLAGAMKGSMSAGIDPSQLDAKTQYQRKFPG